MNRRTHQVRINLFLSSFFIPLYFKRIVSIRHYTQYDFRRGRVCRDHPEVRQWRPGVSDVPHQLWQRQQHRRHLRPEGQDRGNLTTSCI